MCTIPSRFDPFYGIFNVSTVQTCRRTICTFTAFTCRSSETSLNLLDGRSIGRITSGENWPDRPIALGTARLGRRRNSFWSSVGSIDFAKRPTYALTRIS